MNTAYASTVEKRLLLEETVNRESYWRKDKARTLKQAREISRQKVDGGIFAHSSLQAGFEDESEAYIIGRKSEIKEKINNGGF